MVKKPSREASRILSATTGRKVGRSLTVCARQDSPGPRASFGGQTARRGQPMMDRRRGAHRAALIMGDI